MAYSHKPKQPLSPELLRWRQEAKKVSTYYFKENHSFEDTVNHFPHIPEIKLQTMINFIRNKMVDKKLNSNSYQKSYLKKRKKTYNEKSLQVLDRYY